MRSVFDFLVRLFSRPGHGFIFFVALIVFFCAGGLWAAMKTAQPQRTVRASIPLLRHAVVEGDRTVARALVEMAGLAFEEPLAAPLEEGAKQVDFALVQAMLRSKMSLDDAMIEKSELRHSIKGAYYFQRLRIAVGEDPLPFITNLHDSLKAWADRAELSRGEKEPGNTDTDVLWTVSIEDVVTHELMLSSLPPYERGISPAPDTGQARVLRRRAPGEPARMVVVMDDLGEDMGAVRALLRLPYPVTFAVWPHSTHAKKAAEAAVSQDLEIIVHQPAEPMNPEMNPGPYPLLLSLSDEEIGRRVRESLRRVPHATGMNNHMGSRFTRNARCASAMVRPLKEQGLFLLDSMTHPGSVLYKEAGRLQVPNLKRDIFLDTVADKNIILQQLRKAENIALVTGSAIAIGHPFPETLAALREWGTKRNHDIMMVRLADLLAIPGR